MEQLSLSLCLCLALEEGFLAPLVVAAVQQPLGEANGRVVPQQQRLLVVLWNYSSSTINGYGSLVLSIATHNEILKNYSNSSGGGGRTSIRSGGGSGSGSGSGGSSGCCCG